MEKLESILKELGQERLLEVIEENVKIVVTDDFENLTEVIDRINEETEYSAYIKETDREYLIIEKD